MPECPCPVMQYKKNQVILCFLLLLKISLSHPVSVLHLDHNPLRFVRPRSADAMSWAHLMFKLRLFFMPVPRMWFQSLGLNVCPPVSENWLLKLFDLARSSAFLTFRWPPNESPDSCLSGHGHPKAGATPQFPMHSALVSADVCPHGLPSFGQ